MTNTAPNNDWTQMQKQYWDNWLEAQRGFFGGQAAPAKTPWTDFFHAWQEALTGPAGEQNTGAFTQFFTKAGENYMNMLQQFYQGTGQAKPLEEMAKEWTETLHKFFAETFHQNNGPFDATARFKNLMEDFTRMGQPWHGAGKATEGYNFYNTFDPMGFWASMPGIGYHREKQDQLGTLYKLWVEFERKTRDYNAAMAKIGMDATMKFQAYLSHPPEGAAPLTSLKEVYAKWVDVCEELYAEFAVSEEYTKLYGETVNALMAFKKKQNELNDDIAEQLNQPTRREVDALHQQVHALKREIAAIKKAQAPKTSGQPSTAKKGKKS